MSQPLIDITVADGKYRVIQTATGYTHALRHGETWLDVTNAPGGNLILAMAYELEELRARPVPDAAVQVGEEAFRAGFDAAIDLATKCSPDEFAEDREREWSKYEPSEDVKDLVR